MKKLFFIMAMSVCAFMAQAQTTSGIRVGLNMTSATGKYNDLMADQDIIIKAIWVTASIIL